MNGNLEIMNTKVYEIEYVDGDGISTIKIRAINAKEAKRIAKRMTGALIKDMEIIWVTGCGNKAAND
jgi:hypothetical protein